MELKPSWLPAPQNTETKYPAIKATKTITAVIHQIGLMPEGTTCGREPNSFFRNSS
jgi:hypothetical protein